MFKLQYVCILFVYLEYVSCGKLVELGGKSLCELAGDELCVHGTCVLGADEFTCICDKGWQQHDNVTLCTADVDECELSNPCSTKPFVQCINTLGSFHCGSCPPGFTGDGVTCTDINECKTQNGGCSINPLVKCINTLGSRECDLCPAGYSGDGVTCSDVSNLCQKHNGGCHPDADCHVNLAVRSNFVTCTCPSGYYGDGVGYSGCERANNTCDFRPCLNGGSCEALADDAYVCKCPTGYTGNDCEIEPPCDDSYCQNGGSCNSDNEGHRVCSCPHGFSGPTCETTD